MDSQWIQKMDLNADGFTNTLFAKSECWMDLNARMVNIFIFIDISRNSISLDQM